LTAGLGEWRGMRVRDRYVSHPPNVRYGERVLYVKHAMDAGAFLVGNPAGLGYLDVACGMPLGWNGRRPSVPRAATLDEACELAWTGAFGRGPCYIPFSGGRESSMWLAIGARYARQNGYDDPIPVTLRYPGLASAEELQLQERVVDRLGLADWERVEPDGELDLIGPVATAVLAQTGPLWPPNAYILAPLVEAARDGVFVFASGLIDFFAWWRWAPLAALLTGQRRPGKRDLGLLATALTPAFMRVGAARRHGFPPPMPWLRPEAERRALALLRRRQAEVPIRFDRATVEQITHRCFDGAAGTFDALGEALGVSVVQPLRQPGLVESVAGAGGWRGFGGPGELLQRLCGELLPRELLARRPAPDLTHIFFGDATREFAADWSGAGLDESIVDVAALRRCWLSERPDSRTACLLQYAWLAEQFVGGGSPRRESLISSS
jgi:hypothetical protein